MRGYLSFLPFGLAVAAPALLVWACGTAEPPGAKVVLSTDPALDPACAAPLNPRARVPGSDSRMLPVRSPSTTP